MREDGSQWCCYVPGCTVQDFDKHRLRNHFRHHHKVIKAKFKRHWRKARRLTNPPKMEQLIREDNIEGFRAGPYPAKPWTEVEKQTLERMRVAGKIFRDISKVLEDSTEHAAHGYFSTQINLKQKAEEQPESGLRREQSRRRRRLAARSLAEWLGDSCRRCCSCVFCGPQHQDDHLG